MIVAGPMVVLYVLSIAIAWVFGKKKSALADCRLVKIVVRGSIFVPSIPTLQSANILTIFRSSNLPLL